MFQASTQAFPSDFGQNLVFQSPNRVSTLCLGKVLRFRVHIGIPNYVSEESSSVFKSRQPFQIMFGQVLTQLCLSAGTTSHVFCFRLPTGWNPQLNRHCRQNVSNSLPQTDGRSSREKPFDDSTTTGASERQLSPKSAPKTLFCHPTRVKNGPSDRRNAMTTATTMRAFNPQPSTPEIHDVKENDALTEDKIIEGDINAKSLKNAIDVLTRGEGITQTTYRYPKIVNAIHRIALKRG